MLKLKNKMEKEEVNKYLKSIGYLENGFRAWPHYWHEYKYEWLSKLNYFGFWCLNKIKIPDRKNPFRSKIRDVGFFSVGKGWYNLLIMCINDCIKAGWNKEICQVKEKFGGLRFYINSASKEVYDIIDKYESLSYDTCESCGTTENIGYTSGWISTYCINCAFKFGYGDNWKSKEQWEKEKKKILENI